MKGLVHFSIIFLLHFSIKIYKPKHEHYSVVLYEEGTKIGEILDFVYEDGRCGMNHYYWGSEIDYEYNHHGEVEHNYIWDKENTKKLMLRTGTKDGKTLVEEIYKRFNKHKGSADFYIRKWCEEKRIEFAFQVWF